jgi:hypothetical protein
MWFHEAGYNKAKDSYWAILPKNGFEIANVTDFDTYGENLDLNAVHRRFGPVGGRSHLPVEDRKNTTRTRIIGLFNIIIT